MSGHRPALSQRLAGLHIQLGAARLSPHHLSLLDCRLPLPRQVSSSLYLPYVTSPVSSELPSRSTSASPTPPTLGLCRTVPSAVSAATYRTRAPVQFTSSSAPIAPWVESLLCHLFSRSSLQLFRLVFLLSHTVTEYPLGEQANHRCAGVQRPLLNLGRLPKLNPTGHRLWR